MCGMSPFPGFIMTLTVSDRFLAFFLSFHVFRR